MHDIWLGKDPSSTDCPGGWGLYHSSQDERVWNIMFLVRSIGQPQDHIQKIAWEKLKQRGPTDTTILLYSRGVQTGPGGPQILRVLGVTLLLSHLDQPLRSSAASCVIWIRCVGAGWHVKPLGSAAHDIQSVHRCFTAYASWLQQLVLLTNQLLPALNNRGQCCITSWRMWHQWLGKSSSYSLFAQIQQKT